MRFRTYLFVQLGSKLKLLCSLAAIVLIAGLLLPALRTDASTWSELKGTLFADDEAVSADGTSGVKVLLVLRDQGGNAIDLPANQIELHATLGTWAAAPTAVGNGIYNAVLIAPTTAGVSYISAEVAGNSVTDLARVYFKPGEPSPERSVLTASRQVLPADGSSQTIISLQLKDAYGNSIAEPADALQLITTGGQLSSVTHVTYGRYEASMVSAVYGRIGSLTSAADTVFDPQVSLEAGAIPPGTPNNAPLRVSLSMTYESFGTYQAVLTAANTEGTASVTASLNGVSVTSSVYVAFTNGTLPIEPVLLSFSQVSYGVTVGRQVQVELSAQLSDQSVTSVTPFAAYHSADASIAVVENDGKVRGVKAGQTVLTATYGNLTKDASIVVTTSGVDTDVPATPRDPVQTGPVTPSMPEPTMKVELVLDKGAVGSQAVSYEDVQQGLVLLKMPLDGGEFQISGASLREIGNINPQTVLVLQAGEATMTIPIAELSTQSYSQKFKIPENDVRFHFIVHPPEFSIDATINRKVDGMKAQKLAPAMVFEVEVTGGNGVSAFISTFNRYVTRTLPVNGDTVPTTATGVWWVPETSEFHFVPTYFEKKDGQWIAVMKREGASVYTVINRPVSFGDIQRHWAKSTIELLASKLIIQGRSLNVFVPDASITRAEVAALLVRALGLMSSTATTPFPDISGEWYEQAVNTAYRAGLIAGYDDGTFRPNQSVTREELVQMVVSAMIYTEVKVANKAVHAEITDESDIAEWALKAVNMAAETGIIDSDDAFRPANKSTRAETAAMLERMLKNVQFIQ
ncbi:S-layer homology domain-containing protein [Paenibacillus oryzisoli]|uniref:SLH domain-containing protein n=1 Tax=Paenibacillus oryzisoli TaxID=1850517 RepID=A0A198AA72_9BACL|nr:invasin domain 3-containing protein [Paenibacillus oryzisoli]OAS18000.1 hypothetical protein A8708_28745 [Paenibacillus oryzisoli]